MANKKEARPKPRRLVFTLPWEDVSTNEFVDAQLNLSESIKYLIRDHIRRNGVTDPVNGPVIVQGGGGRPTNDEMRRRARAVREALELQGLSDQRVVSALTDLGLAIHDADAANASTRRDDSGDLDLEVDATPEATGILVGGDATPVLPDDETPPARKPVRDAFSAMMGEDDEPYDPSKL